jgi:hypothetical protein
VLPPSPSFPFVPVPSLCRLQHALGDIDAFDELLDNGFVVEAQVEGSGEQRPSEGDMVQVKVEAYVSIYIFAVTRACVGGAWGGGKCGDGKGVCKRVGGLH